MPPLLQHFLLPIRQTRASPLRLQKDRSQSRSDLALLKCSQFRGTAILAVGPAGILPADKCAKATGKMPIFPTAKMAVPRRLARFSTKLSDFQSLYANKTRLEAASTFAKARPCRKVAGDVRCYASVRRRDQDGDRAGKAVGFGGE